jgi:inorganic pyrophosphatase
MPHSLATLPSFASDPDEITAIVETPRGRRTKLKYDPKRQLFAVERFLPEGLIFPYDFGFIPSTRGEDGDPADVLVLMDEAQYPGCVVPARLIGAIEVEKQEADGPRVKNDRLIAVAAASVLYRNVRDLSDLPAELVEQVEAFFRASAEAAGKRFVAKGRHGAKRARSLFDTTRTKRSVVRKTKRKRATT